MEQLEEHQIGVGYLISNHERSSARNIRALQVCFDGLEEMCSISLLMFWVVDFLAVGEECRDE